MTERVELQPTAACCMSLGRARGYRPRKPLRRDELRAIGAWLKDTRPDEARGKTFFVSEQRKSLRPPFSAHGEAAPRVSRFPTPPAYAR